MSNDNPKNPTFEISSKTTLDFTLTPNTHNKGIDIQSINSTSKPQKPPTEKESKEE